MGGDGGGRGALEEKCSNGLGHMTNMAGMPIYVENFIKSSSLVLIDQWPWHLVCNIGYCSIAKVY